LTSEAKVSTTSQPHTHPLWAVLLNERCQQYVEANASQCSDNVVAFSWQIMPTLFDRASNITMRVQQKLSNFPVTSRETGFDHGFKLLSNMG